MSLGVFKINYGRSHCDFDVSLWKILYGYLARLHLVKDELIESKLFQGSAKSLTERSNQIIETLLSLSENTLSS